MSSRSERQKKIYRPVESVIPSRQQRIVKAQVIDRDSRSSGQVRTISQRMLKIIVIAVVILLVLWLTAPKPPALPGGKAQDMSTQTLKPVDLNSVKTTIPPVNTSAESVLGDSFKEKLNLK